MDTATDAAPDAFLPPQRCDLTKPFGAPTVVASINSAAKDIQAMLADDLTLYLTSDRGGNTDLYTATRTSAASAFGTPAVLAGFNTTATETSPYLTADQLTMVYALAPMGVANADLYVATRASKTVGFSAGAALTALNSAEDDSDPVVTADGALLYFASSRAGTGGYDLYVSVRAGATYGAPQLVTELDTNVYDAHPRVTADGLTIYYSSMRTDGGALAGTDVWTAKRASTGVAFGTPTRVAELSTASNESPTFVAADGCSIFLQTDRAGGTGGQDIWEAIKPL